MFRSLFFDSSIEEVTQENINIYALFIDIEY